MGTRFEVHCADPNSGSEAALIVEASNPAEAEAKANAMGYYVTTANALASGSVTLPTAVPPIRHESASLHPSFLKALAGSFAHHRQFLWVAGAAAILILLLAWWVNIKDRLLPGNAGLSEAGSVANPPPTVMGSNPDRFPTPFANRPEALPSPDSNVATAAGVEHFDAAQANQMGTALRLDLLIGGFSADSDPARYVSALREARYVQGRGQRTWARPQLPTDDDAVISRQEERLYLVTTPKIRLSESLYLTYAAFWLTDPAAPARGRGHMHGAIYVYNRDDKESLDGRTPLDVAYGRLEFGCGAP